MKYHLSVIYYPQPDGKYHAKCPELNCFTDGNSYSDAQRNIMEIIPDFLKHEFASKDDQEGFLLGEAMPDKIFQSVTVEV